MDDGKVNEGVKSSILQNSQGVCVGTAMENVNLIGRRHEQTRTKSGTSWFNLYCCVTLVFIPLAPLFYPSLRVSPFPGSHSSTLQFLYLSYTSLDNNSIQRNPHPRLPRRRPRLPQRRPLSRPARHRPRHDKSHVQQPHLRAESVFLPPTIVELYG